MKQKIKQWISHAVFVALIVTVMFPQVRVAQAAAVTSLSDVMSRLKASTASDHEIKFVTPAGQGGVASTETITLTFSADFTGVSSLGVEDFDLAEGNSNNCSSASFSEESLVASGPTTSQFSAAASGNVVTFTSGGATAIIAADVCVRIRIGLNATSGSAGNSQVSNGAVDDDDTIVIGGTFGDTGTLAVDIITDDQVTVSATVDPTISFSISDNTIGFGSLSSSAARFATGDTNGSGTDSAAAHTLAVGTNASSGYVLSYNGATLTSGANTINVASITNDADGTQDSEQFGVGYSTNGSSTIATGYDHNSTAVNRDWAFVAGTTTTVVSRTSPTSTETISAFYLANISSSTESGSYSTTITYVATGTF